MTLTKFTPRFRMFQLFLRFLASVLETLLKKLVIKFNSLESVYGEHIFTPRYLFWPFQFSRLLPLCDFVSLFIRLLIRLDSHRAARNHARMLTEQLLMQMLIQRRATEDWNLKKKSPRKWETRLRNSPQACQQQRKNCFEIWDLVKSLKSLKCWTEVNFTFHNKHLSRN